jgi:hypothetical protein
MLYVANILKIFLRGNNHPEGIQRHMDQREATPRQNLDPAFLREVRPMYLGIRKPDGS